MAHPLVTVSLGAGAVRVLAARGRGTARSESAVRRAIDEAFVAAFRLVMIGAASLALAAAAFGMAIR